MSITPANHCFTTTAEDSAIQTLMSAYESGREAARNGWDHDPRSVPGVRLAASTREAYVRGYDDEMEKLQDEREEEEREREVERELEAREEWDGMIGW